MKAAAPELAVFSSHSLFVWGLDQYFDAADIVGFHTTYRRTALSLRMLQSFSRAKGGKVIPY